MKLISSCIKYSYLILLFFTPLLFASWNSELFELPKMYFIFGFTIIISSLHLINFIIGQSPLYIKNKLNIFLIFFIISQVISTLVSVDPHTSIFGYYSRINGGLISIISFSILFFILPVYSNKKFIYHFIDISLLSAFLVSIYAIAQHFGIDNNKWIQDVQNRVFSSFGQPNWLAAYLSLLLPISLYKNISEYSKNNIKNIFNILITISLYISILYTKSKSGIIATIISLIIFLVIYIFINKKEIIKKLFSHTNITLIIIFSFFIFSTLLTKNPISQKLFPEKNNISTIIDDQQSNALNLLITPSQDIRKIVWQGTFKLWKKFPIFGTGVETFAYSYYWTRPASHNLTSEWDFLYNKAHNEYLNYLSTTGIIGITTYLLFIIFCFIKIISSSANSLLKISLITSLISILITNFAGFSVAIISLYFFLLPQIVENNDLNINNNHINKIQKFSILVIILITFYLSQKNINFYLADIAYNQADYSDQKSDLLLASSFISSAVRLNPYEPLYFIKSAGINAQLAVYYNSQKNQNGVNQSIDRAIKDAQTAINISPANTNHWKERAQIYYYLSTINPEYFKESINSLLNVTTLAPTDAKTFFLAGQFYEIASEYESAALYFQKAIELKPNYDHAYFYLGKLYFQEKKYDLAKVEFENTLKVTPQYTAAQDYLDQIEKNHK